jgi:hypothetical protein
MTLSQLREQLDSAEEDLLRDLQNLGALLEPVRLPVAQPVGKTGTASTPPSSLPALHSYLSTKLCALQDMNALVIALLNEVDVS